MKLFSACKYSFAFFLVFGVGTIVAQELNCLVQVVAPKLQNNARNTEIFENLKTSISDFINEQKWTNDVFSEEEKIDCSMLITIDEESSAGNYSGSIQVQSSRPVYNSSYKTPVFLYKDQDFQFTFERNTALIFTSDRHSNNLTSVLAYYAYIILGFDYDSFSLEGGTKYFIKAQQIVSNAQNAPEKGWKSFGSDRNRFKLVENVLQSVFKPMRKCVYNYHREGFDNLYSKQGEAVNSLLSSMEQIRKVHRIRPLSMNQQIFFTAKLDELVQLFKEANPQQKNRFMQLVRELDPSHINTYEKVQK